MTVKKKLLILLPVIIGIAFSIFAIWYYGFESLGIIDDQDYINAANAFLNDTPYPRRSEFHPMFRPPLLPLFIAAIWSIFPESTVAFKIAQALLHGATVFIAYKTIYELLRKNTPAVLGALICAVNPLLIAHTVGFNTEPLHTFLCALAMYLLVALLKDERYLYLKAAGAGISFGLATLNRPAILGVVICLVFALALLQFTTVNRVKYWLASLFVLSGMFLTILPWTVQNYRDTGEFILVNDGFSYNLWLGNLPESVKIYEGFNSKEENEQFANYLWGEVQTKKLAELEKTDNYSSLTINEREKVWRREALKNMTADYSLTARLMAGKLWAFWTPFLNKFTYGNKVVALVALFVIGIYVLGAYGAYLIAREKTGRKFIVLLAVTFLVTTAIHVLIFGFVRYRVPNVDPYMCMLSGIALWHLAVKIFPKYNFLQS